VAVKLIVLPEQTGELEPAVGAEGVCFTETDVEPAAPGQPLTVAITEYEPESGKEILLTEGFCKVEENPLGPLQLYEALAIVLAVSDNELPVHTGELELAVGAEGVWLTVTETEPALPVHPLTVADTEYEPASDVEALVIEGFCAVELKLFGPVHA